jgi:hypothetical protein
MTETPPMSLGATPGMITSHDLFLSHNSCLPFINILPAGITWLWKVREFEEYHFLCTLPYSLLEFADISLERTASVYLLLHYFLVDHSILEMETVLSAEASINSYKTTRNRILGDTPPGHCCNILECNARYFFVCFFASSLATPSVIQITQSRFHWKGP